ncbi:uncharacterized protein BCR38DRAFT_408489 [Pseudomassariella vexata]|uniref:Uncharacterized protein n=1 Tax=Pseudomassariella vexata TaxID=1141098 RepID=A0A1Y2E4T7_9PEZI|nr:uncharacterized protein BCR38DRAFT_408489 [Pseudomassariella vexata]ORY66568.1 hypothetical protein BCR38DRAFT_408489 [Pseudomassariella vexata]
MINHNLRRGDEIEQNYDKNNEGNNEEGKNNVGKLPQLVAVYGIPPKNQTGNTRYCRSHYGSSAIYRHGETRLEHSIQQHPRGDGFLDLANPPHPEVHRNRGLVRLIPDSELLTFTYGDLTPDSIFVDGGGDGRTSVKGHKKKRTGISAHMKFIKETIAKMGEAAGVMKKPADVSQLRHQQEKLTERREL